MGIVVIVDLVIRFFVGGLVVSAFAVLGDIFRPKSFAGLFGAAPSVALATLALTITKHGVDYAVTETRSMMAGAIALGLYCQLNGWLLMRFKWPTLAVTTHSIVVWFAIAFGLRFLFLR